MNRQSALVSMAILAPTMLQLAEAAHRTPHIRKEGLRSGDIVVVRTERSEYRFIVREDGEVTVSGGWFDRKGLGPTPTRVAGVTWGGSAIIPGFFAATGMRMELGNRLITSPVRSIVHFHHCALN